MGNPSEAWQKEWQYSNHAEMLSALGEIIAATGELEIGETIQKWT